MYRAMVARARQIHSTPKRRATSAAATTQVTEAVRAEIARGTPSVLAVSGGRDSMVLLEAVARVAPAALATVATFDHGTGVAASLAASLVQERARGLGFHVRSAKSLAPAHTEAEWRAQRQSFLTAVARELDARIITAHTLDDHLETVLMRVLRGAGARGIAGLLAPSSIGRPLVGIPRATVAACARAWSVPFVEDPTNRSRRFLRNRVRLDVLPALTRARPEFPRELLDLSRRAAELRVAVERYIEANVDIERSDEALAVSRRDLAEHDPASLALLWPAIAARQGVTLDRRGTERLVSFTIQGAPGARIQLSGGVEALRHRDRLLVRRLRAHAAPPAPISLTNGATWGEWRFVHDSAHVTDRWIAALPADVKLSVRGWRPGDRMVPEGSTVSRRLKGLLRDAGIDAMRRRSWPVVVADEEVIWVPGVRRALAAPARSGRPTVTYRCEHIDR
jgi:tRNA(Ile)-lysidine synthase